MEYIKYFEELDFFKKLSKSIKPSEIGREHIYNPKTKEEHTYLQIHEVYYNEQGVPDSVTKNAVTVGGDDIEEIKIG